MKDNKLISELTYDTLCTWVDSQMSLNNFDHFMEWNGRKLKTGKTENKRML